MRKKIATSMSRTGAIKVSVRKELSIMLPKREACYRIFELGSIFKPMLKRQLVKADVAEGIHGEALDLRLNEEGKIPVENGGNGHLFHEELFCRL